MPGKLPGVKVQPVVRHLDLVPVDNLLLEDSVAVPQTVAPGGIVETRETVEEASRQTAETAVAQRSIVLLRDDILDAEAELGETSCCAIVNCQRVPETGSPLLWSQLTGSHVLLANVQHGIVEGPAHQELQAQVVDPLGVGKRLALLGAVPFENQAIAKGQAGGRVGGRLVAVEHAARQRRLDVAHHLALEAILVLEAAGLVLCPGLSLGFRDGSCLRGLVNRLVLAGAALPHSGG